VRGANLYYDLDLAPWEAVLGATVHIPTLDGTVSLKVPAGTVSERQFRLRGKGLPTGDGTRGDLYAVVSVDVPSRLTAEQKALWEQLAATSTFNPRKPS
jgi:curved DNA-binding protein